MTSLFYTLGPSSEDIAEELLVAGATGVRLGFSYSDHTHQAQCAIKQKTIAKALGTDITVIADLAGEKFRLGRFEDDSSTYRAHAGQRLELMHAPASSPSGSGELATPHDQIFNYLSVGDEVVVGDGSITLVVEESSSMERRASLVAATDGQINPSRGLTIRGSGFRPRSITEKEQRDLAFIAQSGLFDAVALSFVSNVAEIDLARATLREAGQDIPIIAKIETVAGLNSLDDLCKASDMVMAARGDLALSMPWTELYGAVQAIEGAARENGRPWIVATQIAEGLENFSMPTRAEICDLSNWISRGCAGALLSYETAFGSKPVEAVRCVKEIVERWSGDKARHAV